MATFRVEKTRDYTVMSNHHLRNKALSLKAKGLLSQMLSLPESWDYTLKGLSCINRESIDAIRTAVWELEKSGYIVRQQGRDEQGKMTAIEYTIYERPQDRAEPTTEPQLDSPMLENPTPDNPTSENPASAQPTPENPTQLNTNGVNTYPNPKTEAANPNQSNPYPSYPPPVAVQSTGRTRQDGIRMGRDAMGCAAAAHREVIHRQIEYELLAQDAHISKGRLDEVVDLMVETLCVTNDTMLIAGIEVPTALVRERFRSINSQHIQYVFHCLDKNTTRVRNIKKYLLAVLYNAPCTMDGYYAALVNQEYGSIDLTDLDF